VLQRIQNFITFRSEEIWGVSLAVFSSLLGLVFYAGIGYLIFHYWSDIVEFVLEIPYYKDIILIIAILIGPFLYIFRTKQKIHYGLTEITFGFVSIFTSVLNSTDMRTSIIQGAAGVYIVVRGLDNIQNGVTQRPSLRFSKAWKQIFPEPPAQKS
jgi:hypothetical protein